MSKTKKLLMKVLGPLFLAKSKVIKNERLSPHFQFLTIKGSAFKKSEWTPGQKIQVKLEGDQMRSYTPSSWDRKNGVIQTLVYMHGKGPGALWARDAKKDAPVTVLGPRASLFIAPEIKNMILFGDETIFGLAHALKTYYENTHFHFFFEATDINESKEILKKFNLEEAPLFGLNKLDDIALKIATLYHSQPHTKITLSGKQQSIVALREKLYEKNISPEAIGTKVYWGWKDDPNGKLKK